MRIMAFRRHSHIFTDVGLLVVFRIFAIIIGLFYVKIYTGHLLPDALGVFFYLTTLSYLINALIFVPFDYYIQAYCARAGDHIPLKPVAQMTAGVISIALLMALVAGTILVTLEQLVMADVGLLLAMAILLFGCTSLRNLLNNRGHRRIAAASLLIEALARLAAFLTFLLVMKPSGRLLFASAASALAVELLILAYVAATRLQWRRDDGGPVGSPLLATMAPISGSAVCNLVQLQGYRTMYPWSGIPTTAAIFSVVANIGAAGMMAAGQVFSQILLPRIYQSRGDFIYRYIQMAALLIVAVGIFAWMLSSWLVPFMTSPLYGRYAGMVIFGVIVEGSNLIVAAIAARAVLRDETSRLIVWNIAGAVVGAAGYGAAIILNPESPTAIGVSLMLSQIVVLGGLMLGLPRAPSIKRCATSGREN